MPFTLFRFLKPTKGKPESCHITEQLKSTMTYFLPIPEGQQKSSQHNGQQKSEGSEMDGEKHGGSRGYMTKGQTQVNQKGRKEATGKGS